MDVLMIFLSALLQKSWDLHFTTFSGRLSLAITYLSFLVLFNAYSASIIVFLQGISDHPKTFSDLYRNNFELGVHNVNYNKFYFMVSAAFATFLLYCE